MNRTLMEARIANQVIVLCETEAEVEEALAIIQRQELEDESDYRDYLMGERNV